jgi:hypothetical protein
MTNRRGKAISRVLKLSRAFFIRPLSSSPHFHLPSESQLGTIRFITSMTFSTYYYLVSALEEIFNETSPVNNATFDVFYQLDPQHEQQQSDVEHQNEFLVNSNDQIDKVIKFFN